MRDRLRSYGLIAIVSSVLSMLFFEYLHFSEKGFFPILSENIQGLVVSILIGCISGFVSHFLNQFLDSLLSWKSLFASRFILGYVAQVAIGSGIVVGSSAALIHIFNPSIFWEGLTTTDEDLLLKLFILILTTAFIYMVVYSILYSYKQYAVTQIESVQSERKQLELQFEALKSQLSPHYLFNSLNTISSLIYNDPKTAEQFIRRLAITYQYILSTQHKKYVALADELEFVESYYYLLRIRFQQSLTMEVNLPKSVLSSPIPPLTLQLLVENAVKHNTITSDRPLFIYINSIDNTQLRITNTKNESNQSAASFKIGLDNIRKRYQFFTDRHIEVKDDEKFVVVLPVIKLKTTKNQMHA